MLVEIAIGFSSLVIGAFIGRRFKKETIKEVRVEVPGEPLPATPYLKFYSLADFVDAKPLVEEAATGASVFINLEKLNLAPYKRHKFLADLKEETDYQKVVLRSLNPDLVMLIPLNARVEVKTLSPQNYPMISELRNS